LCDQKFCTKKGIAARKSAVAVLMNGGSFTPFIRTLDAEDGVPKTEILRYNWAWSVDTRMRSFKEYVAECDERLAAQPIRTQHSAKWLLGVHSIEICPNGDRAGEPPSP
jgi:hypothetical protein